MLDLRLSDDDAEMIEDRAVKCKVFLGCTSNIISSGVRATIWFLVEHKQVDVVAGGVEVDLIKRLADSFWGYFSLGGVRLREQGLNRIDNLLVTQRELLQVRRLGDADSGPALGGAARAQYLVDSVESECQAWERDQPPGVHM